VNLRALSMAWIAKHVLAINSLRESRVGDPNLELIERRVSGRTLPIGRLELRLRTTPTRSKGSVRRRELRWRY
jgi:hypothetical protein